MAVISLDQFCLLACVALMSVGFIFVAYLCAAHPYIFNLGFW